MNLILQPTVKVPLGRGKFAIVSELDAPSVMRFKWCVQPAKNGDYAAASIDGKRIQLHRFIKGNPKGFDVDHKNGITLDCRRSNLRVCTRSQNCANSKKSTKNTSGFKGVYWNPINQKWIAQICISSAPRKMKHLGCFGSREEAALAYSNAANVKWGEFSKPSPIDALALHEIREESKKEKYKEPMSRLYLAVPNDLHQEIKSASASEGLTIRKFFIKHFKSI